MEKSFFQWYLISTKTCLLVTARVRYPFRSSSLTVDTSPILTCVWKETLVLIFLHWHWFWKLALSPILLRIFPQQHEMRWKFVSNSIKPHIYCVESAYNAQDSWRSSDRMSSGAFLSVLSDGSFCQRRETFTSKLRLVYLPISHLRNTKWSCCLYWYIDMKGM